MRASMELGPSYHGTRLMGRESYTIFEPSSWLECIRSSHGVIVFECSKYGPLKLVCRPTEKQTEHWAPGTFAWIEFCDCRHAVAACKKLHGTYLQNRMVECEVTARDMNCGVAGVWYDDFIFEKVEETIEWSRVVSHAEEVDAVEPDGSVFV